MIKLNSTNKQTVLKAATVTQPMATHCPQTIQHDTFVKTSKHHQISFSGIFKPLTLHINRNLNDDLNKAVNTNDVQLASELTNHPKFSKVQNYMVKMVLQDINNPETYSQKIEMLKVIDAAPLIAEMVLKAAFSHQHQKSDQYERVLKDLLLDPATAIKIAKDNSVFEEFRKIAINALITTAPLTECMKLYSEVFSGTKGVAVNKAILNSVEFIGKRFDLSEHAYNNILFELSTRMQAISYAFPEVAVELADSYNKTALFLRDKANLPERN